MAKIKIEKHDSVKMYRIRKTLDEISDKTGHGTELITVYIPKGKQLHEVISILKEEQGTADNIKSDFTRSHVVDSLGKVIQRLKMYKKTPERFNFACPGLYLSMAPIFPRLPSIAPCSALPDMTSIDVPVFDDKSAR